MSASQVYRALSQDQINTLTDQGCSADDWSAVTVADGFNPLRVRNTHFAGRVEVGEQTGNVGCSVQKCAGLFNAWIADCTIGDNVRIANIGVHLANYNIGDNVNIENVGRMETRAGARFGNGVEVEVLNEGGGREVSLFNHLNSQFAHLLCLHRYREKLIEKLTGIADAAAESVTADRGTVGDGACICSVREIIDVNIGPNANIDAADALVNGTILSAADAPTAIGAAVQADNFIIAEGSEVSGGAVVSNTFIGQGCQIGKQFSAEGTLMFANGEGFHGEACSWFAGPYSVTHHKSTLMIAVATSFYNAGSGTNQSNHMYKLGPVHEGKMERGAKTGSFSYMMWPCRVGPFSVVLGKHTRNFDTSEFPFTTIEATSEGRCQMVPGLNLSTVGTVRDGAKWPARDRRKGAELRDRISFDVFSPFIVGRMISASRTLNALYKETDKSIETVTINGAEIRRVLLRTGQKFYRSGIEMYLLEKVVARIEAGMASGKPLADALAVSVDAASSAEWVDIGGQLMARQRLDELCAAVESGKANDMDGFFAELDRVAAHYAEDEWAWVKAAYRDYFNEDLDTINGQGAAEVGRKLLAVRTKFLRLILADAGKEFAELSQLGFGQDGAAEDAVADFAAVRGLHDDNSFIKQMNGEIEELEARIERFAGAAASA